MVAAPDPNPSPRALQRGVARAPVRILLLEDVAVTAEVVRGYVAALAPAAQVEWAATLAAALEKLAGGAFDLVLADLNLPDSTGFDTLERLLAATDRLVVVLTSEDEATFHEAAIERGAYDFLHKSRLSRAALGRVLRLATLQAETFRSLRQSIAELELRQRQLDNLELYDPLTGLANRSLLLERVHRSIQAAAQAGAKFPLLLADLERFRTVNESLGRRAGDALLRQAAARLARAVGRNEAGRTGPDQFAAVLPAVPGRSAAARRVQALLRECFAEPFVVDGVEIGAAARAGVALYPNDGADAETLLKHAEAALRKGKDSGEHVVFYARSLTTRTAHTLTLENKLRRALRNAEFVLHYQPKVDTETRRIAGVEALIRWQSPELGLVPPMHFIPLMEETGMILKAGAWALRQAAADHARWRAMGLPAPRVAVNVSPIQLRSRDFVAMIGEALGASPQAGLDLEVTESLVMQDIEGNMRKLREVRALGMSVAIDDFGTGHSSLAYLAKLPVQSLKIDRSFVSTMLADAAHMTLVQMIISLARSLKLTVIAEGVESEDQARMLRLLRCDELQGFLFSRPLPFGEMSALLAR
ncbi:MAG: GGDEF domain-containing response regulator [Betaproteobacteria bacterium]|nr:GGDEF domain-containing response regulator [Betaproteobacteria bacterium]